MTTKNHITITIKGRSGVGKTTIAQIIKKALQGMGLTVKMHTEEDDDINRTAKKLISIQQAKTEITIHEQQTIRESQR
jgi:nucleoside-triphosphatase THEP1